MFVVFNIILIAIVALIAYWWANQGLFSALLHLLCVIVAGAIALAFWEPLTLKLVGGSWFDNYAWGVTLVGLFVITLFILRQLMDRLVPNNMNFPHWASMVFGGAAGAASGTITLGITIIGLGHLQTSADMMGYNGWQRSSKDGMVKKIDVTWLPYHTLTAEFYTMLSVGSLRSSRPLAHYAPQLDRQATLFRDSYDGGKGKCAIDPKGVTVRSLQQDAAEPNRLFVTADFTLPALDYGEQLTLTSAQVRLIEDKRGSNGDARTIHPIAFYQYSGYHLFDHVSHMVSSEPGKDSAPEVVLEFDVPLDFTPRFIQIKGIRFPLPLPVAATPTLLARMELKGEQTIAEEGAWIQSAILINNSIRPINVGANNMPPGMTVRDKMLVSGETYFSKGLPRPPRDLRVQGIFEPDGARCIKVNVSRNSAANLFGFADRVEPNARILLLDADGTEYTPVGYILEETDGVRIKLEPTRRLPTIGDLPVLPTSGNQKMYLIFYVTESETVTGLTLGDVQVGSSNTIIPMKG